MRNYDFNILSPDEFERLSRDLLQLQLNITLESFKPGKDQGIDFRFSNDKSNNIIVQAKRYDNYSSLIKELKKEALKLIKLKPTRYILTTSVGLNPQNKDQILQLFKPFIRKNADIYGRTDLNNLLNKYPQVEENHYKLWISSTDILRKILHNSIHNQSFFDYEDIHDTIQKYVENPSLVEAEKMLKQNRVVIISGIPGIGKTTLAKALSFKLLGDAESKTKIQFISIHQNIQEAYTLFDRNKAQLFFFDDFLGTNFYINNLERNEDKSIVQFVEKISKSANKYLICTTREYILQQARETYEGLKRNNLIDIYKYIIDLKAYTSLIRATILYNHLYFSKLPTYFFREIVKSRNYLKIIQHSNFNPRIIELVTDIQFIKTVTPNKYVDKVILYLQNPEEIWNEAYERQITKYSRLILLIMSNCGTPIIYEDLFDASNQYIQTIWNEKNFNSALFKQALRELENTFIKTNHDKKSLLIDFQNPSIRDFLQNYINHHQDFIPKLFSAAIYLNQYFDSFTPIEIIGKTRISDKLFGLVEKQLVDKFNKLTFSSLTKTIHIDNSESLERNDGSVLDKIIYIINHIDIASTQILRPFLLEVFSNFNINDIDDNNIYTYIRIYSKFHQYIERKNDDLLLKTLLGNINFISSLNQLFSFQKINSKAFLNVIQNVEAKKRIATIVDQEISNSKYNYTKFEHLRDFIDEVGLVIKNYHLNIAEELSELEERLANVEAKEDESIDYWQDSAKDDYYHQKKEEEEEMIKIEILFDSLILH